MKNLLKYFHDLTIHPKNAAELKALILQLAVQGKLTAKWRLENPEVEPASVLLERIQAKKAQLVKDKKMREVKALPEMKNEDALGVLPESWIWCRFSEIVINRDGERKPITKSVRAHGEYDYYGASGVIDKVQDYIFDKDLLLIGEDGANLINRSTPIAFFARGKYWVNNHAHVLDASHFTILEYLEKYINGINLEDYITGMAQPKMPQKRMNIIPVPLPPLEEQKAIVSVVNQLFAEVEQLEALTKERIRLKEDFVTSALQQLTKSEKINGEWAFLQHHFATFFTELPNIKKLRESILQLAVQGKLTTHWRSRHPELVSGSHSAEALLERIKTEKAQLVKAGKIKKEKPLPKITAEEIPYELPDDWVWCRIGFISTIKGGKRIPKGYQLSDTETPHVYIRVTDMKDGTVLFSKLKYITEDIYEQIKAYTISSDDLYITIAGTIGDVGEIPEELDNMNLTENAAKIMFNGVNKQFLKDALRSKLCRSQFHDKVNQMAQPKLALHRVASTLIPLPPLPEQKAIVEKVNALMALCDQLEQEIQNSKATQEDWMKSSLREVFEEAKPKTETKAMDLDGGELGMVAEPGKAYGK
ncbi:restriction endonuclease subunit S [Roseimarinus sediminis]|uniref:restriction endonuclease subunit S n=1 Tax=Roseimarinus sediminis TaxID=1610899 RepID=UPI003D2169F1